MDWEIIFGNAVRAAFGPSAAVFALAAIGLNVHYGYTGLLNFGHVGFMLVGAYGLAISEATFGLPMWVGVIIGVACSALLALALGWPTLRLRAGYFAITTIAAAEILRLVIRSSPFEHWTGGVFGLQTIGRPLFTVNPVPDGRYGVGVLSYSAGALWTLCITWSLVGLTTALVVVLMRSPWGRAVKGVRDDEDAARSLGKNAFSFKMQSLILGGVIGGMAGLMFAIARQAVNADGFLPQLTFYAYATLILGGAASPLGPIVGSCIFWFLFSGVQSFVREGQTADVLPGFLGRAEAAGAVAIGLVGVGLMLLLVFRPQGIFGKRREIVLDVQ